MHEEEEAIKWACMRYKAVSLFILGFILFSAIGFCNTEVQLTTNYISGVKVWNITKSGTHLEEWITGTCLDLDLALTLLNSGQGLYTNNISIACSDAAADIKFVDVYPHKQTGMPDNQWNNRVARKAVSNPYYFNCDQLEWTENSGYYNATCGLTDNNYYFTIYISGSAGDNDVYDVAMFIKNETYNPYFTVNYSSDITQSIYISTTMNALSQIDRLHLFLNDLGWSTVKYFTSEWTLYYDNIFIGQSTHLSTDSGKHKYYNTETTPADTTLDTACSEPTDYTGSDISPINNPTGTYDIFCHNGTANLKTFRYAVLKVVNVTNNDMDAYFSRYTSAWTNIYNVHHYPEKPAPNMTVTVYWTTSSEANGTLFWRNKPIGNWTNGWSSWASTTNTNLSFEHNIKIDGENILENYQYQYFVMSGTTTDNNTNIYYNFTVGGIALPTTGIPADNVSYPVLYNATTDFCRNFGCDQIEAVYLFAFLVLGILLIGTIWFTHNPVLTVAVFITGIAMFSLFGFLPYYLFIIIAIIVALAMVKLLGGMYS